MVVSFSKSKLKKLGDKIRHGEALSHEEEDLFAQYRSGHWDILKTFRAWHEKHLRDVKIEGPIIFASRLKKRATISMKLASRHTQMDMTRMHDIAGCRLIFPDISTLFKYRKFVVSQPDVDGKYVIKSEASHYDYILNPRDTGYRGIHDVYEEDCQDPIKAKIEVQYRTLVQHSWATALEIWDNSHKNGAKFGLEHPKVQRLFALISELFWRYLDSDPSNTRLDLSPSALYREIVLLDKRVGLIDFFSNIKILRPDKKFLKKTQDKESILLRRLEDVGSGSKRQKISVIGSLWDDAVEGLFDDEKDESADSVLVSMDGINVRKAYNNYFSDADSFKANLGKSLSLLYDDIQGFQKALGLITDVSLLLERLS